MNAGDAILLFHREDNTCITMVQAAPQEARGRAEIRGEPCRHAELGQAGPHVKKVSRSHVPLGHAPLAATLRAVKTLRIGNTVPYSQQNCQGQRLSGEYLPLVYLP